MEKGYNLGFESIPRLKTWVFTELINFQEMLLYGT